MDLRQIETFKTVADLKSFSKAAEKLFITQPTVSNHIQYLEKELDTLLINRLGRSISLTEAGEILYKYALSILNSFEMAKYDLASYKGNIQGHINIHSSSVPRKYMLPKVMEAFTSVYPNVTFTISDKDSNSVVNNILQGETDFGIVGAKFLTPNLEYIDFLEERLVLAVPQKFKIDQPNYSTIGIEHLIRNPLIFREEGSGTRKFLVNSLNKENIDITSLNIIACVEDSDTIKEMIKLNMGVSFISKREIANDVKLGYYNAYYIDKLNEMRQFYFVFNNKIELSPLNKAFKSFVLDKLSEKRL